MDHLRICLVIGSRDYQSPSLGALPGAQGDADELFSRLIEPTKGNYDPKLSIKLISPTLQHVKESLKKIAKASEGCRTTFSFFFSGHGVLSNESLFLTTNDTDPNFLSLTAFPASDLLRVINEFKFAETNIVIDACEAGGMAGDIGAALTVERFGLSGSPSITLFASAAGNQPASETAENGLATSYILKFLDGKLELETTAEYLDLINIGSAIATDLGKQGEQQPVCWGLSLTGQGTFTKNLKFDPTGGSLAQADSLRSNLDATAIIRNFSDEILNIYVGITNSFDARDFISLLERIHTKFGAAEEEYVDFALGLKDRLIARAKENKDLLVEFDVLACFLTAALWIKSAKLREKLVSNCVITLHAFSAGFTPILKTILEDKFPFSYLHDSLAGLVLYPLRVTETLSVLSSLINFFRLSNLETEQTEKAVSLIKVILEKESERLNIVSDEQAAHLANVFAASISTKQFDVPDSLILKLLDGLKQCDAKVLTCRADTKDYFLYSFFRSTNGTSDVPLDSISRPPISPLLLLLFLVLNGKNKDVDGIIQGFDRHDLRVFAPNTYKDFHKLLIEDGTNFEVGVGRDCFRSEDLVEFWNARLKPAIESASKDIDAFRHISTIAASCVMPDRQCFIDWLPNTEAGSVS